MLERSIFKELRYLINYPENFDKKRTYPVIVFLHGAGTRSEDYAALENNSPFKKISEYAQKNDMLVIAPHCSKHNWNSYMQTLIDFIEDIKTKHYIDCKRIYLTGNSMGGYGTWELACQMSDTFAAIMPVCGGGMHWLSYRVQYTPILTFHGLMDDVVLPYESISMVQAVNKRGGNAILKTYPHHKHNVWDDVYGDTENLDWLTANILKTSEQIEAECKGEIYG